MLHTSSWDVVRHLGDGKAGLEKEGLRVTKDGFMARTRDPFVGDPYIVKDFSENQTEINTPVCSCIGEAVDILEEYAGKIRKTLKEMPDALPAELLLRVYRFDPETGAEIEAE